MPSSSPAFSPLSPGKQQFKGEKQVREAKEQVWPQLLELSKELFESLQCGCKYRFFMGLIPNY